MGNTYLLSDIHGQKQAFFQMLKLIQFSKEDVLYVLGDVGDRGADGIEILRYIMKQDNIKLLMGNHEDMLLSALEHGKNSYEFELWMFNGGMPTYEGFQRLSKEDQEETIAYIKNLPLYDVIAMDDQLYLLVHAGIIPTEDKKDLFHLELTRDEILWVRREFLQSPMEMEYGIIFGHTPTPAFDRYASDLSKENLMQVRRGHMVHWHNRIAIDCGAAYRRNLGCLKLNTGEEFYVRIEDSMIF